MYDVGKIAVAFSTLRAILIFFGGPINDYYILNVSGSVCVNASIRFNFFNFPRFPYMTRHPVNIVP